MCGVGFSGKSTLAKKISEHTGAVLISQDGMFFELEKKLSLDEDSDEQWRMLLDMCKEKILENLKEGKSVVFDNTNTRFEHREELREFLKQVDVKTKVVFLDTPIEIQKQRQQKNKETGQRHDVKQEYLDQAIAELEIPTESENVLIFKPDTNLQEFLSNLD
jgi:predicted kinase